MTGSPLEGVKYAVFGCGNRDWATTYQRVPKLIDNIMKERGGAQLIERGEGDAAGSNFFEVFDDWEASLWEILVNVSIL